MRHGDTQKGSPAVIFSDTQANIEALAGITEGAVAYATDLDQPGWYDGAAWDWLGQGGFVFANEGLHVLDTDASHVLIIKPGSDLDADRTLTLTTGDADRTLDLGGNLTIGATTSITGGGTLALGGFTFTVPATGTAALLGTANVFTAGQKIDVNGLDVGSTTTGFATAPIVAEIDLFNRRSDKARTYNGPVEFLYVYNRVLLPNEVKSLFVDPYQMFHPPCLIARSVPIPGTTTVQLDWTDVSENEDGFSIERATDAGVFGEIDTVGAGVETYDDLLLPTGHTYHYRVRAISAALGYSEYSNEADVIV